jgi:membrane protein YdbS with pleckstrin-like domain
MAKLDEVKSHIDWLKDLFKILVAVLVAAVAGVSKLYIDMNITVLFYAGIILIVVLAIWISVIAKKIEKHIKELGDL